MTGAPPTVFSRRLDIIEIDGVAAHGTHLRLRDLATGEPLGQPPAATITSLGVADRCSTR